jgi:nitroreductase
MKKLFLTCCMTAFCAITAMAQAIIDPETGEVIDSVAVETTDSAVIEEPPLDNPVTQAIMGRRSIRKYLNKPVEHEKLVMIAECAINAPSGSNRQPWLVRVIENQELLAEINEVYKEVNAVQLRRDKSFKNMFRNAPNVIVVCTPAKGGGEVDAGMLAENIMLAAHSLGLGTCCLGGIVRFLKSNDKAQFFVNELNIPVDYRINFLIAIGYPDESPEPKPRDPSRVQFIE